MKMRLLTVLLILIVCSILQTDLFADYAATKTSNENVQIYRVESNSYKNAAIEITYPSVVGLTDTETENEINEILKNEAFKELFSNANKEEVCLDDMGLSLGYDILYKDNDFLSVRFTGHIYIQNTPYPRSLFSTINIDINNGIRIRFSDMIDINQSFIDKIRECINSYIINNQCNSIPYSNPLQFEDYDIVYLDMLKNDDEYFISMFEQSDSDIGNGSFSYFTKDVFGISFATAHNAGDHFEIELKLEDIEKHLFNKIY